MNLFKIASPKSKHDEQLVRRKQKTERNARRNEKSKRRS